MSATPYADQWRADTRDRIARLGVPAHGQRSLAGRTGLPFCAILDAVYGTGQPLDFETASIIDETLRKLEDKAEARALRRGQLVAVAVDLNALTNCDVHFTKGVKP